MKNLARNIAAAAIGIAGLAALSVPASAQHAVKHHRASHNVTSHVQAQQDSVRMQSYDDIAAHYPQSRHEDEQGF